MDVGAVLQREDAVAEPLIEQEEEPVNRDVWLVPCVMLILQDVSHLTLMM